MIKNMMGARRKGIMFLRRLHWAQQRVKDNPKEWG